MKQDNLSFAILAGGKSKRIGKDKGFLMVKGQFFIENILRKVRKYTENVFIVSANPRYRIYAPVYFDVVPDFDVLSGIYSAVYYAETEQVFVLPCDMPLITHSEIDKILRLSEENYDAVLLKYQGKILPYFGLYNTFATREILNEMFEKKAPSLEAFLEKLNVCYVEHDFSPRLIDVNTKEDYLHLISNTNPKT